MTDHMGRTLADAIKAAAKLKDELPHIVQVYPSDHDTIIMAAEIERLREALAQIARLRTDLSGDFSLGSHQSDIARAALGEMK